MAELRLSIESQDGCVVVTVGGELDVVCSQRFDECLTEASSVSDQVILDLSAVDFMDTTALAVIVGHWRRQVAAGGRLLLAGARYRYTRPLPRLALSLAPRPTAATPGTQASPKLLPVRTVSSPAVPAAPRGAFAHPDEEADQPDDQHYDGDPPQDVNRETEPAENKGEQ